MNEPPRLPGPSDHARPDSQASDPAKKDRRRRSQGHIPQVKQILEMLAKLPLLVTLGHITPGQSNAILRVLTTMLTQLQGNSGPATTPGVDLPTVKESLRRTPELFDLVAPMLSEEQLAEVLDDEETSLGA
jgi:hypothetical protein